jgi:hypothetical protein
MSSILYAEVTANVDDRLTFLLAAIQTFENFVESPTLATQLLLESWHSMWSGSWLADDFRARTSGGLYCPFPPAEAAARAAASPIRELMAGPLMRAFQERAATSPMRELMAEQWEAAALVDKEFIRQAAGQTIRSTRVVERRHCNRPFRHRFAPTAECVFEVQVAAAAWIGHLAPGVCWDTTAYPYESGW